MTKTKYRQMFALFLAVCLLMCCTTVTAETDPLTEKQQISASSSTALLRAEELPPNIQELLPDTRQNRTVYLQTSAKEKNGYADNELYTLKSEDPFTGEGTVALHSTPIKYIDDSGQLRFINTSLETVETARSVDTGYIYRNTANSFTVEYGKTAVKGVNFADVFTFGVKPNSANKIVALATKTDTDKVVYADAFGAGTMLEYINVENGIKENIILDKYTGQSRFDFIFRSDTHVPILAEDSSRIWIANKKTPEEPEYRFLSLYAYDSYKPAIHGKVKDPDFRHMNEELYYDLTANTDGSYTITVVVPEEYLTHPEIVYPVTIDPSLEPETHISSNQITQDNYVNEGEPDTVYDHDREYIRFGKVNGYKNFGYHRFVYSLPEAPENANITTAELKFTYRTGQTTPVEGAMQMWVLQVAHYWKEKTITWNNQPYGTAGPVVDIAYDDDDYLDYFQANITEMVCEWYSGISPNYGVDFTYANEEYNDYNSVVSAEGDAGRTPVLTINYQLDGLVQNEIYYIRNVGSNKYLNVSNGTDGTVLTQQAFSGNSKQQFKLVYNTETLDYSMRSVYATNSAVEIVNCSYDNNAEAQIWTVPSSGVMDSQRFRIKKNIDGTYQILTLSSDYTKALQIKNASSSAGAWIVQYASGTATNQKWYIERVQANGCSRAVTTIPSDSVYTNAINESEARYNQMSLSEYMANSEFLSQMEALATAGALAATVSHPVASDMLLHFLEGTGNTYTLPSGFIRDSEEIIEKKQEVCDSLEAAYDTLRAVNSSINYGNIVTKKHNGNNSNSDWDWSVNSCELWGVVTYGGSSLEQTTIYVRDVYNWKAESTTEILGVASNILNMMHYAGIARNYPVDGHTTC